MRTYAHKKAKPACSSSLAPPFLSRRSTCFSRKVPFAQDFSSSLPPLGESGGKGRTGGSKWRPHWENDLAFLRSHQRSQLGAQIESGKRSAPSVGFGSSSRFDFKNSVFISKDHSNAVRNPKPRSYSEPCTVLTATASRRSPRSGHPGRVPMQPLLRTAGRRSRRGGARPPTALAQIASACDCRRHLRVRLTGRLTSPTAACPPNPPSNPQVQ